MCHLSACDLIEKRHIKVPSFVTIFLDISPLGLARAQKLKVIHLPGGTTSSQRSSSKPWSPQHPQTRPSLKVKQLDI